jgi:RNA polymerase sigma-70 factor (ECF subfamily)
VEKANCHHLLENMSAYLDGETSAELCAEIERHLDGCHDCQAVVDTLRKTIALYHELPQPALPLEARLRLYASLDLSEFLTTQS